MRESARPAAAQILFRSVRHRISRRHHYSDGIDGVTDTGRGDQED
jgi:hypothetical protein